MVKRVKANKEICATSNLDEIMQIYAKSTDRNNPKRDEDKLLFCWNYGRLEGEAKDEINKRIQKGIY